MYNSDVTDDQSSAQIQAEINVTLQSMSSTMDKLEQEIDKTVGSFRSSVDDSVRYAKRTLSVYQQAQRHPFLVVGTAATVGYLAWRLVPERRVSKKKVIELAKEAQAPRTGFFSGRRRTEQNDQNVGSSIAPELATFKALAMGIALGAVRDLVADALPRAGQQVTKSLFDRTTQKLGGIAIKDRVL